MKKIISTLTALLVMALVQSCAVFDAIDQINVNALNSTLGTPASTISGYRWGRPYGSEYLPNGGSILKYVQVASSDSRQPLSNGYEENLLVKSYDESTSYYLTYFLVDSRGIVRDWARGSVETKQNCTDVNISPYISASIDNCGELIDPLTISNNVMRTSSGQSVQTWYQR